MLDRVKMARSQLHIRAPQVPTSLSENFWEFAQRLETAAKRFCHHHCCAFLRLSEIGLREHSLQVNFYEIITHESTPFKKIFFKSSIPTIARVIVDTWILSLQWRSNGTPTENPTQLKNSSAQSRIKAVLDWLLLCTLSPFQQNTCFKVGVHNIRGCLHCAA